MTWTGFVLAAGLALGTAPQDAAREEAARRAEQAARADVAAERAEDVEVMRRILNRAVGLPNEPVAVRQPQIYPHVYPNVTPANQPVQRPLAPGETGLESWLLQPNVPNTAAANPLAAHLAGVYRPIHLADPFDGVYLKGHGVVYTLKVKAGEQYFVQELRRHAGLAAGCTVCHVGVPVPAAKLEPVARSQAEPTEWDRTRNALRGVKDEPAADPAPTVDPKDVCRPGKLAEALVSTLMKNGRHIRHLAGGEGVTVVVTLDGLYGPARVATATDPNRAIVDFLSQDLLAPAAPAAGDANRPPAPPPEAKLSAFTADETKQITLGDLHLKQNNPKEAAAAYQKALARFPAGKPLKIDIRTNASATDAAQVAELMRQSVIDVRKKLAQAHLAAGNLPEAKAALESALNVEVESVRVAAADAGKATVPVPAKLVLTVKKTDLDRAEKLTAAEFKKLVAVETVGLPPADKAKK
jgi:hypothetical protein